MGSSNLQCRPGGHTGFLFVRSGQAVPSTPTFCDLPAEPAAWGAGGCLLPTYSGLHPAQGLDVACTNALSLVQEPAGVGGLSRHNARAPKRAHQGSRCQCCLVGEQQNARGTFAPARTEEDWS